MVFISVFVTLALLGSVEASVGPSTNNSFCTESKECLEYELVCKTDEYEVRHYSPTRWVSTDAEAYFMGVGAAMAFRRLFQYITGANEGGVQMEMTAPVLVKIPEETKMWEPAIYTLNFPLPAAYQDNPPTPTNDKLCFTEMPEMDVYVRSYGGWMLSVTSRLHAHLLTKELDRVGASYNHNYHYGVGYDSPLKLLNRHNEVWYVAEGEPVCSDPQEPTPPHTPRPTPTDLPTVTQSDLQSDTTPDSQFQSDSPTDSQTVPQSESFESDSVVEFLADSPSEPLPLILSDSPSLPSSNQSSYTNSSSSSSQPPPDTPAPSATADATSPSSSLPTDTPSSLPPTSTHILEEPTTTNSSDPITANPSLEPLSDSSQWNSTAPHSSTDTPTDSSPAVQPTDAHQ